MYPSGRTNTHSLALCLPPAATNINKQFLEAEQDAKIQITKVGEEHGVSHSVYTDPEFDATGKSLWIDEDNPPSTDMIGRPVWCLSPRL